MKTKFIFPFLALLFYACNFGNKHTSSQKEVEDVIDEQPNIIVILVDDAGYVDFGFMGSEELESPQIDALAADGVVFTDAHVSSTVCAPSRAGLITGQYQHRFGFEANHTGDSESGDIGLAEDVTTIANAFQNNKYKTVAIGKWHLGEKEHNHPNQRGFDDFYGFLGGGRSYFPMENPSPTQLLQHNNKKIEFEGYLTDVLGDYSVQYIEENKDKPFFMYLSYNAVHTPMEAKEIDLEKYKNHPRKELAAMTWSLDENIGKLRTKLKELNLHDNTLIYFLSDNGGAHNNQSSSGELKGWKGNEFEGGHRVPFIVSWPNKIEKGWTFNGLTSSLDIFKTSIAAADIQLDKEITLDGKNLIPYLTKEKIGSPHQELYWRKLDESAARLNNYKLVKLNGYGSVMYDLENDLGETKDISTQDSIKFKELKNNFKQWESQLMNPLWGEDEQWEEITHHIHKRLMQDKEVLYKSPPQKRKYLISKDSKIE